MKKKILFLVLAGVCLLSSAFAGGRKSGEMPAPRLLAPGDIVEMGDRKQLEFRWGSESGGNFDHYDFRLYRGTQTYEQYLILQKDVPAGTTSLLLDSSQFKVGETYAWSLRYMGARRSLSSYSIFKVKS